MGSCNRMRDLLAPLGVYRWKDSYQWAELKSAGAALDECEAQLEHIQKEMNLMTAEDLGLSRICAMLSSRPATTDPEKLRRSLVALLRIQDGSFTLAAINENLDGCGLIARAVERGEPGKVGIVFPELAGQPENFDELKKIIEEIIPCHLEIEYLFWYIIWSDLEQMFPSWRKLEEAGLSWKRLEAHVS